MSTPLEFINNKLGLATMTQSQVNNVALYSAEFKKLSVIAGPLILSSLVSMGVSIIDIVMMSWLGATPLAAGAIVSDYYSVFFYFFVGIIAAISALISHAHGAGDHQQVREITQTGFFMAMMFGLVGLTIMWNADAGLELIGISDELVSTGMPYAEMMGFTFIALLGVNFLHYFLSAHGETNVIFYASAIALPFNALGNYTLMFGNFGAPEMGLAGAGLSSFMATLLMFAILLLAVARKHHFRQYHLFRRFSINRQSINEIFRVGMPIGVSNLGEMGVFLLVTVIMGRFGAEAVAAHIVALRMAGVIYAIPLGYAQAATVRIGYEWGAKNSDNIKRVFKMAMFISAMVGLLYLLVLGVFREEISLLFLGEKSSSPQILAQASLFLLILAISQPIECIGTVGSGVLRGFQKTKSIMMFSVIGFWGFGFFGGITLAFQLNYTGTGLWIGLASGSIVFGLLIAWRLLHVWRLVKTELILEG